jgi:hypothetical protein
VAGTRGRGEDRGSQNEHSGKTGSMWNPSEHGVSFLLGYGRLSPGPVDDRLTPVDWMASA